MKTGFNSSFESPAISGNWTSSVSKIGAMNKVPEIFSIVWKFLKGPPNMIANSENKSVNR